MHRLTRGPAVLLLAALAAAQTTPPKTAPAKPQGSTASGSPATKPPAQASKPAVAPDEGSISNETYTSDYFGFRYTIPEELAVREDFMQGEEDESKNSYVLLAADGIARTPGTGESLVVLADSAAPTGVSDAGAYIEKVTRALAKQQGFEPVGETRAVTLGGHEFARADFQKQNAQQSVLVVMRRGYAVNFIVTAPTREEVEALLASLNSLTFPVKKTPPAKTPAKPGTVPKP